MTYAYDSMPPVAAHDDYTLRYEGFHGIASHCRVRVYRPHGNAPVIVATQAYDVEDPGTSITNRAELVFRLAWSHVGEPWPVLFVEHYAGQQDGKERDPKALAEHWAFVSFPTIADGGPVLREDLTSGSTVEIENTPIGFETRKQELVSLDVAFGAPSWDSADRRQIEHAIGRPLISEPIRTEVVPATIDNSPTMRFIAEHFSVEDE